MLKKCLIIIGAVTILAVMLSCSGTPVADKETLLDRNWGRSLETAKFRQTVNPDAEKNLDPVVGLDGKASVHNVDKYQESFKETEQKEIINILRLQ